MLDMGLMMGKPALQVGFRYSLAADILHTMALIRETEYIEGLDPWMYETRRMLPATLRIDIALAEMLANGSGSFFDLIYKQPDDAALHADFDAFMRWVKQITSEQYHQHIVDTLACLCGHCGDCASGQACLDDPVRLREVLGHKFPEQYLERVVGCARNPLALKELLESTLLRFWEQFYGRRYDQCATLMERSVLYHQQQNYSADLLTVISQVTGRQLSDELVKYDIENIQAVVFLPSAHLGPYLMFAHIEEPVQALYVHYNGRPTSAPETDTKASVLSVQTLYPPLKALADETRLQILSLLQGRELYAQEIVDQLDISQSAVSRHLKLMTVGGILKMRKEESMRYFSINESTLNKLMTKLGTLKGPGG